MSETIRRIGVVAVDFGGPQGKDELVPFLTELLTDVLPGPMALKRVAAPAIAKARAKKIGPAYESIGWSPIVPTHRRQIDALRAALGPDAPPIASGMMFTAPKMRDAVRELKGKVDALIALPMFPHYSRATTGAAFGFLWEALVEAGMSELPVHWIPGYFEHPDYLDALAATIRAGVARTPGTDADGPVHLVFTPHGLPVSFVRAGDPYPEQVRATARQVIARMGWDGPWSTGWQSRVGPAQWLEPSTIEALDALAAAGTRRVCLVPVAFASEHIETLYEIDVELAEHAHKAGIPHFGRAPALGVEPGFVACLADLVRGGMARFGRYQCMRCLHPKPDAHRRRAKCPNCSFDFPAFLRDSP